MRRELVLCLAGLISTVLLICTLILLVHWFGYLPVLLAAIVVFAVGATIWNRETLLRSLREAKRRTALRREEKRKALEVPEARPVPHAVPPSTSIDETPQRTRYISSKVKREVWRRDEGRCVECKSKERLEYDHIIPHSKGGSNTARNIQLLCEECNRSKAAKIE